MKKLILISIVVALCAVLPCVLMTGCNSNEVERVSYNITLAYDGNNTLLGEEKVCYINTSENMFTSLYFHLYANAFKDKEKVVAQSDEEKAYYAGENHGEIEIISVNDENGELEFGFLDEDEEILIVELEGELYPGECANFCIKFSVLLANVNHRLGVGERTVNIANFYPIACVYENGVGFKADTYHSNGDPFYSECADYQVKISYPSVFTLATSGNQTSQSVVNLKKTTLIKGENLRDFAMVLSQRFKTSTCGKVVYYGYEGDENLDECARVALKAVDYFSSTFGEYPYQKLSVVKSSFFQGGMEFPSLVMISDECAESEDIFYVIVHEIAHQWWYGVVGNDQYNSAWIDEGLAEYSAMMFFREFDEYGINFEATILACHSRYKLFEKVQNKVYGESNGVMDRALNQFETAPEYVALTYTKGALMFNALEQLVGERKFAHTLKNFYEEYSFKNAKREDLIASFSRSTHSSQEKFFASWLDGKVVIT